VFKKPGFFINTLSSISQELCITMNRVLAIAAANGFLAVMLGAFGAHGLENLISADRLDTWQTGVQYHMFHTLALLGSGLLIELRQPGTIYYGAAQLFLGGIILFSGSLYLLALTGVSWLGMITPAGGLAFLGGWGLLFIGFWRQQ